VVAQGQAKANDALSRSISPILVQYKSIEKWNGILPQVCGGAVPFIDLGKMGACRAERRGVKNKISKPYSGIKGHRRTMIQMERAQFALTRYA